MKRMGPRCVLLRAGFISMSFSLLRFFVIRDLGSGFFLPHPRIWVFPSASGIWQFWIPLKNKKWKLLWECVLKTSIQRFESIPQYSKRLHVSNFKYFWPSNLICTINYYGVSRLTVRTSSALLLTIVVDGEEFVEDASQNAPLSTFTVGRLLAR